MKWNNYKIKCPDCKKFVMKDEFRAVRCIDCSVKYKKEIAKRNYENNKEQILARAKNWREKNSERAKEIQRNYKRRNYGKIHFTASNELGVVYLCNPNIIANPLGTKKGTGKDIDCKICLRITEKSLSFDVTRK